MAILDDIGKKIADVGHKTMQMTRDMTDTLKYNSLISGEEKTIQECYLKLGEMYYREYANASVGDFKALVNRINEANANIENYRNAIEESKNASKCPQCGAAVSAGDVFCSNCGKTLINSTPSGGRFCCGCGKELQSDAEFCIYCGARVSSAPSMPETGTNSSGV